MAESLLRDLQCRSAKPRAAVYRLRDGGGLFLQVRPTGLKYWQFRYTKPDGRESSIQIGPYPRVTLEQARTARNSHQAAVARGDDPSVLRKQDKARRKVDAARSMTFKQCAGKYIEAHEGAWRNVKHGQQWTNTLTLMLTCRACNVEPYAYLLHVLTELPQRPHDADVSDLLPFNFAKRQVAANPA